MYKNPRATDSGIDISYDDGSSLSRSSSSSKLHEVLENSISKAQQAHEPEPEQQQQQEIAATTTTTTTTAAAPTQPTNQEQQPRTPPTLLTLPLELRLEIYGYLLRVPSTPSTARKPRHALQGGAAASLLRACRQLHGECLAYLLERNEFTAHASLLAAFPRLLGPGGAPVRAAAQAARIRRIRVPVRLDVEARGYDAAEAARQLGGRREVVLEAFQADWRAAGPGNLRLFEAVRGVGRARVEGSTGGFEDYARWLERTMMCAPGEDVGPFCGKDHLLTLYD